jgi:hypothetical protein
MADKISNNIPWLEGLYDWYDDSAFNQWGRSMVDAATPYMQRPLTEQVQGAVRGGAQIANTAANTTLSGLAALGIAPKVGLDRATEMLKQRTDSTRTDFNPIIPAYNQPTGAAAEFMNSVGAASAPVAAAGPALGNLAFEATGSPLFATAAHTSPDAALMALGLRNPGTKGPRQYSVDELFPPERPRIPEQPKGPYGSYGTPKDLGAMRPQESGAVRIIGRNPDGTEIYERVENTVDPVRTLYASPAITVEGTKFGSPKTTKTADAVMESPIGEGLKRINRNAAPGDAWIKEFEKAGVTPAELRMSGIVDAVRGRDNVTREDIVNAYNDKQASVELWATGETVKPMEAGNETELRDIQSKISSEYNNVMEEISLFSNALPPEQSGAGRLQGARLYDKVVAATMNDSFTDDTRELFRTSYTAIPEDAFDSIVEKAQRSGEYRKKEAELEKVRSSAINHPAGRKRFAHSNQYLTGGELWQNRLSVQVPKKDYPGYNTRDLQNPDRIASQGGYHYTELETPESAHLLHMRTSGAPVMDVPTLFKDGEEYRPTATLINEYQSDPGQEYKPGRPNMFGGLRTTQGPDVAEKKAAAQAAYDAINAEMNDLENTLRDLRERGDGSVPRSWQHSLDNVSISTRTRLLADAGRLEGRLASPNEEGAANRRAVESLLNSGESIDYATPEEATAVRQYIEFMRPYDLKSGAYAEASDRRAAARTALAGLEQNYALHENMPLIQEKKERRNAMIMAAIDHAIRNGDEYAAVTSMRGQAESYYYSKVAPDEYTAKMWVGGGGEDSPAGNIYYNPQDGEFYNTAETDYNGRPRQLSQNAYNQLPADFRQELIDSAADYDEWRMEAIDELLPQLADDMERRYFSDERRYFDHSGQGHNYRSDAYDANYALWEEENPRPDREDFETVEEYDEAVSQWDTDADNYADEINDEMVITRDEDGEIVSSEQRREEAEMIAQNSIDNDHFDDDDLDQAHPEGPWYERASKSAKNYEPPAREAPEPMGPMPMEFDVPEELYGTDSMAQSMVKSGKHYRDDLTVETMQQALKGLGLNEEQIAEAFGSQELGVKGFSQSSARDTPFLPGRRMRMRTIKITPALLEAWDKETVGGLFGPGIISPRKAEKPQDAVSKPNPGKIIAAYKSGKLDQKTAASQLQSAGVPEERIGKMLGIQ